MLPTRPLPGALGTPLYMWCGAACILDRAFVTAAGSLDFPRRCRFPYPTPHRNLTTWLMVTALGVGQIVFGCSRKTKPNV